MGHCFDILLNAVAQELVQLKSISRGPKNLNLVNLQRRSQFLRKQLTRNDLQNFLISRQLTFTNPRFWGGKFKPDDCELFLSN